MEAFGGWIREIVMILVFVVFLELLIPRSSMEKLIRVVLGLLILATILKPVVVWVHDFHPLETQLNDRTADISSTELNPMGFLKAAYEQGMAYKIKTYLTEKGYEDHKVTVTMAIDGERITVGMVTVMIEKADSDAVQAEICQAFGLASENVVVKQGGRGDE